MHSSIQNSSPNSKTPSFSPFLTKSLVAETTTRGFVPNSVWFSPKHNIIIACTLDPTIQFYDATTLLPIKERKSHHLLSWVRQMSYHPETDLYLLGCNDGDIFLYNATNQKLKTLVECLNAVLTITFLNSSYYALSVVYSQELFLGSLEDEIVISFGPYDWDILSLRHLTQQKFLLAGLENGSVVMYRTDKLPSLPIFCSLKKAHGYAAWIIQSINLNRKECILTVDAEGNLKIWHLVKGKMRLLKIIKTEKPPTSVVYLENHKMIAISYGTAPEIKFYRFPSGKLEKKITLSQSNVYCMRSLFVMKERNMIGVASVEDKTIEFIQLGS